MSDKCKRCAGLGYVQKDGDLKECPNCLGTGRA